MKDREQFEALAGDVAARAIVEMQGGPIADVSPERTKRVLAKFFLATMLEIRKRTVEDVAIVVRASGQPWAEACALGIVAAFPEPVAEGSA